MKNRVILLVAALLAFSSFPLFAQHWGGNPTDTMVPATGTATTTQCLYVRDAAGIWTAYTTTTTVTVSASKVPDATAAVLQDEVPAPSPKAKASKTVVLGQLTGNVFVPHSYVMDVTMPTTTQHFNGAIEPPAK